MLFKLSKNVQKSTLSLQILFRDMLAEKAHELQLIGANTQDIQDKCRPSLDETLNNKENISTPTRKKFRPSM